LTKIFWSTVLAGSISSIIVANAANQPYLNTVASQPTSGVTRIGVERAKICSLLRMQSPDENGVPQTDCQPLVSRNPSRSIADQPPINCVNGLSPPLNRCAHPPGCDGALEFRNGANLFPFVADNLDGSYETRRRSDSKRCQT
jgi:hypothetical protein